MKVSDRTGSFAGDKDVAASIREEYLIANLSEGRDVELDFAEVDLATQSFIHALIASVIRESPDSLDRIIFANCNPNIRSLIEIVSEYAQDEFD